MPRRQRTAHRKLKNEKEKPKMMVPRNEYPRPQLARTDWLCLNGEWQFEIDNAKSGMERRLYENGCELSGKIIVPFCPESKLSGVENRDFMACVWYKRTVDIPAGWKEKRIILNFGAVDYHAIVFVNGVRVCEHRGGYTPFSVDITDKLSGSGDVIALCAYDDVRAHKQPAGKQSSRYDSYGCFYTRTTGIWQTVWLEAVGSCYVKNIRITPTPDRLSPSVELGVTLEGDFCGTWLWLRVLLDGEEVGLGCVDGRISSRAVNLSVPLTELRLWDVGQGNLYDVEIEVRRGKDTLDRVASYFGMRSVALDGRAFRLNGRTVFGRWVLDQGFYPDGVYTAPTDDDLKNDILRSMELGFNGARLHEKVFEPRFLYWADKLGYLCWGEHANWGLDVSTAGNIQYFLPEWVEAVERDYSHPSIIGWCPFNETWDFAGRAQDNSVLTTVYRVTKALDPTRPVIDTSGNYHVETDIFDVHDYEQNPELFRTYYDKIPEGIINDQIQRNAARRGRQKYDGKLPVFVSEYGGIGWMPEGKAGWGYGKGPATEEEFIARYRGLTDALLDNEYILGFCYTQLYDVEQEKNGLMTYDRKFKFDPAIFREINSRRAAIEEEKRNEK